MESGKPLIAVGDKFGKVFQKQIDFQRRVERLNVNYPIPKDSPDRFIYHMSAMTEELGEVLKADKRWKTHRNATYNKDEKLDELADCYITMMNTTMWSGFDANTIIEAINRKIDENNKRLDTGRLNKKVLEGEN